MFKKFSKILNSIKNGINILFNKDTPNTKKEFINYKSSEVNMEKLDLNNLYIIGFKNNIKLEDSYNKEEITKLMINNWIGYFECHKCGKWDYCKYAQKHPVNPNRSIDIQCGIAIDFITNFINTTFPLIKDFTEYQKQAYLNSAYYLTCFVENTEQVVGGLSNKDQMSGWGEYAPSLYGMTKYTNDLLNKAHKEMKNVPFFNSKRSVLFVEGESEEIFANSFLDIEVINYGGAGNLTYSKIEYTIKQYHDKGYKVYIQADKDGKQENQNINKIISKGLVDKENIFCFKHDYETSVPIRIFHKILVDTKTICDTFENFKSEYDTKESIVKYVESKYQRTLTKPLLSTKLCEFINKSFSQINPYYDESFLKTEIGQFWYFLKTKIVH
ncbi:MAG: hypothetical protein KAQ94_02475 [Arcobacteraceae bacterium]|nr:hypothetical protein [Arcobacteraceae bacterium]